MSTGVTYAVSTWRQPVPPPAPAERAAVLETVVRRILACGPGRLRIGIDGATAAGKTSLGHELAERVAALGRPTLRASLDDFKRPWRERHLYDRESGEGYYRNAFDLDAARRLLLEPMAPEGSGEVALCSIDPITQCDHSGETVRAAGDAVLIVDGVFAFRPELDPFWHLRVWVEVDEATSLARFLARQTHVGGADPAAVLRDRYHVAERLYRAEADPRARADVVFGNADLARPVLLR